MRRPSRIYLKMFLQPSVFGNLTCFPHDPWSCKGTQALRKYVKPEKIIRSLKTDFKIALALARHVSEAWSHDGFNSNPQKYDAVTVLKLAEKGASFSCVQFGSVFVQLCHAVGIPARVLHVQTKYPGFGSSGQGHVTAEYFDNQLRKWVWVDPQIHAYATLRATPLSFNEFAEALLDGKKPRIHFSSRTLEYVNGNRKALSALRGFAKRYIWITHISGFKAFFTKQSKIERLGCKRSGIAPPVTFQGFAAKMFQYVPKENFDAPLNACRLTIETLEPKRLVKWKGLLDYKKNAHKNFAAGTIRINLEHNMPWFDHYVVVFNGKRRNARSHSFKLNLKPGKNFLTISAVNRAMKAGIPSMAEIHFDNKYKPAKNFW